jgi:hypothetical protein
VLRLVCDGPHIQLVQTSHASIQCETVPAAASSGSASGGATLVCTNTCVNDDECRSVFLAVGNNDNDPATAETAPARAPWGRVTFQCLSNSTLADVDAQVTMSDESGASLCNPSNAQEPVGVTHLLRLGVQCSDSNATDLDDETGYTYDDYYFECRSSIAIAGFEKNWYTCLAQDTCAGVGGCTVAVMPLTVQADLDLLLHDECLEASAPTVAVPPSPPTLAPRTASASKFVLSARFEAGWGILVDETSLDCSPLYPTTTMVRIACLDGAMLSMVSTVFETVRCTTTSTSSVVECTDTNPTNFHNRFTGLIYVRIRKPL